MADELPKHPGYLGLTSRGVILIHADWPAYAVEHGTGYSLLSLGQFPVGATFTLLDDIDQCFLFVLGEAPSRTDAFAEHRFHVALWHEDVRALAEAGYLVGGAVIPYSEWARRRVKELQGMHWERPDGTLAAVPLPDFEEEEDYPESRRVVIDAPISLTAAGHAALEDILQSERNLVAEPLMRRVRPAILANLYDTAVREACLVLESTMRQSLKSQEFGARLVEQFFGRALASAKFIPSQLKTFRTEVRAVFRFVRNDFAHNLHVLTQSQCYALLARVSGVYEGVESLAASLRGDA